MYLVETITDKKRMMESGFTGPGFSETEAEAASHMEVYGSSFNDPGPDFCEFVLMNSLGQTIAKRRIAGY